MQTLSNQEEIKLNKVSYLWAALLMCSGCATQNVKFDSRYGKIHTMPENACLFVLDRPSVGLIYTPYNSEHNTVKYDGVNYGLVINNVLVGSPADTANVPLGVVMLSVNGVQMKDENDFSSSIQSTGQKLNIEFVGNGGKRQIQLVPVKFRSFVNECSYQFKYKSEK